MNNYSLIYKTQSNLLRKLGLDGEHLFMIVGPCAVENEEDLTTYAHFLTNHGIKYMRAGAFKPRTSPYDFQGLGYEGMDILKKVKEKTGIKIVTELIDYQDISLYEGIVDIIQIGARNMQNFPLLRAVGRKKTPVILKRGFGNSIDEWLGAAEYILESGNPNVILCERGIKTFEEATRNTLDLSSVAILKNEISLPVIVDPSHATGRSDIVSPLSLASIATGADGLLIEIHINPKSSLSDGAQSLTLESMENLLNEIDRILPTFYKKRI